MSEYGPDFDDLLEGHRTLEDRLEYVEVNADCGIDGEGRLQPESEHELKELEEEIRRRLTDPNHKPRRVRTAEQRAAEAEEQAQVDEAMMYLTPAQEEALDLGAGER